MKNCDSCKFFVERIDNTYIKCSNSDIISCFNTNIIADIKNGKCYRYTENGGKTESITKKEHDKHVALSST